MRDEVRFMAMRVWSAHDIVIVDVAFGVRSGKWPCAHIRAALEVAVDAYVEGLPEQLVDAGLRPTSYTFSALINAYVLAGDVSGGERVMSEMRAAGCLPNVVTYTTLLKGHCAVGDLEAAKALLLEMTTSTPPVKADLRACNTFLRGARRHTCMRMAPRHAPHPVTAAAGCIRVGDLRRQRAVSSGRAALLLGGLLDVGVGREVAEG